MIQTAPQNSEGRTIVGAAFVLPHLTLDNLLTRGLADSLTCRLADSLTC
jgi:hypothetical protein